MTSADAYQAGRLLALALDHSARPGPRFPDYELLLTRWRTDLQFAEIVNAFAEGIGLVILGTTPQGLVVSGEGDGPFSVELDDLPPIRSATRATDRLLAGLVLIAIAAYAYPSGGDLTETSTVAVRPRELTNFITRAAERVATMTSEDELDRGAALAAQAWLDLPPILQGERGRLRRECQLWHARTYLEWLTSQGRARTVAAIAGDDEQAYQLTDRFRLGVSAVVDQLAFTVLAETRLSDPSAPTSDGPDTPDGGG